MLFNACLCLLIVAHVCSVLLIVRSVVSIDDEIKLLDECIAPHQLILDPGSHSLDWGLTEQGPAVSPTGL